MEMILFSDVFRVFLEGLFSDFSEGLLRIMGSLNRSSSRRGGGYCGWKKGLGGKLLCKANLDLCARSQSPVFGLWTTRKL
jgi:hypothetical protein